jgi:hypothetical protein
LAQPEAFEDAVKAGESGGDLELVGLGLQPLGHVVRADELILAVVDSGDLLKAGKLGELVFGLLGLVDFNPELFDELLNGGFFYSCYLVRTFTNVSRVHSISGCCRSTF